MAVLDPSTVDMVWSIGDVDGKPVFGVFMVGAKGASTYFPVFFLSDANYTYYYWSTATTGAGRYGTTAPTVATRASAGTAWTA